MQMVKENNGDAEGLFMKVAKQKGMSDDDISSFLSKAREMFNQF